MSLLMMDIFEEHLDESSFLWGQWERALMAPNHDLEDTAILEERLLAHLDGLVVGGAPVVQELLKPALESEEPQRISSALWALLAGPEGLKPAELVKLLEAAPHHLFAPLQRALELSEQEKVGEALLPLLRAQEPHLQALALEVLAFREEVPRSMALERLQHADARVVTAALQGLRPLPTEALQRELHRLLKDERPRVQEAALQAALVSGAREAWQACREAVETRSRNSRLPLVMLALGGNERDLQLLLELAGVEALQADVVWALGFSGRLEAAEMSLELMGKPSLAPLAGEAFSAITGLRLEEPYASAGKEEEKALPPLEEDLERDLELRPEDDLLVPNREAVASWWHETRGTFARRIRYVRGRAFSIDNLLEELERGPMRRRHMLALELAIRSHGTCLLQTRAFTRRQRAGLEKARAAQARLSSPALSQLFGG